MDGYTSISGKKILGKRAIESSGRRSGEVFQCRLINERFLTPKQNQFLKD